MIVCASKVYQKLEPLLTGKILCPPRHRVDSLELLIQEWQSPLAVCPTEREQSQAKTRLHVWAVDL